MFIQCFFSGYWFPLEQMNYIVTLNCRDMFPQSSLDKSNSTGSPVRQVLPAAMPASWLIEEIMPVSCRFFCMHIYLFSFKFLFFSTFDNCVNASMLCTSDPIVRKKTSEISTYLESL